MVQTKELTVETVVWGGENDGHTILNTVEMGETLAIVDGRTHEGRGPIVQLTWVGERHVKVAIRAG